MRRLVRTTLVIMAAVQGSATVSEVMGQGSAGRGAAGAAGACSLLTIAEVRKLTGRADIPEDTFGDPPGEGMGGGSSCNWGGETLGSTGDHPPRVVLVYVPNGAKAYFDSGRSIAPKGSKIEALSGVGDAAYTYADPDMTSLWVRQGAHTLVVQMELTSSATPQRLRPALVALARTAAARVR